MQEKSEPKKQPLFGGNIKLKKEDYIKFITQLHEMQLDTIEESLNSSDLKESKELIKYIMEKK